MQKRQSFVIICLSLILILSLSFISAGFFSDIFNKFTGEAAASDPVIQPIDENGGTGETFTGWTQWFDRDDPSGTGDYETLVNLREEHLGVICDSPIQIECRVKSTQEDYTTTGETVTCNTETGFMCRLNQNGGSCLDYEVRFYCGVVESPTCTESWNCDSWSECINNQQTRTCTDVNNCGTIYNKPEGVQACILTGQCTGEVTTNCDSYTDRLFCESLIECKWGLISVNGRDIQAAAIAPPTTDECVKKSCSTWDDNKAVCESFGCTWSGEPTSICGNGILEEGEECDDGNTLNGDWCSSSCTIEPGLQVETINVPKDMCGGSYGFAKGLKCHEVAAENYCIALGYDGYVSNSKVCSDIANNQRGNWANSPTDPLHHNCGLSGSPYRVLTIDCFNPITEEFLNATISLATLKQSYQTGETIGLTDPPEEDPIEGESVGALMSLLEDEFTGEDIEIKGYFVQLKEDPIIKKEIEFKRALENLEESSASYSQRARTGFVLLRPYYQLQANNRKDAYESASERHVGEIEDLRESIDAEHGRFLNSAGNVVGTGSIVSGVSEGLSNNKIEREFDYIFNGFILDISEQEAEEIESLDSVEKVYPNYKVQTLLDSSISAMNFDLAREYTGLNGEGVTIAVIDTGIDASHESLDDLDDDPATDDPKVIGWMDFVNFRVDPYDDHGHGTHVSGIAAGTGGSSNYIGVAPKANLVGVKVLNGWGGGTFSDVIAGMEWVVQHKEEYNISIISMSLGANVNSDGTTPVEIAADYAVAMGINFAVAAGNSGGRGYNTVGIPASAFNVTTVGAVDDNREVTWFSSRGPTKDGRIKPEVAAVGLDVTSSFPGNGYREWSGTSMATPHVAGFMALLLQQDPSLTPMEVRDLLMQTAVDKGIPGPDNDYGWGVVDALETFFSLNPPEHEIGLINLDMNNYVILNEETEIVARVKNYGLNTENINIKLLVDDVEVNSQIINLLSKETKDVNFIYIENIEGLHEFKVEVVNIPGEVFLDNNVDSKEVEAFEVLGTVRAVVLESWGGKRAEFTIFDELNENWFMYGDYVVEIDYNSLDKEDITYEDIVATNADVLIISNAWTNQHYGFEFEYTDSEIQAIKQYVEEGHGLIGTSGSISEYVPNNAKLAGLFGLKEELGLWNSRDSGSRNPFTLLVEDEILTKNIPDSYSSGNGNAVINLEFNETNSIVAVAKILESEDLWKNIFISAYKPASGASVYFSHIIEYNRGANEDDKQFFYNAVLWTKENLGDLTKDISIYDLQAPEKARLGEEVSISATVSNGPSQESSFGVNLIIDEEVIETTTLNFLPGETEATVFFSFTPTEIKDYKIILEAVPLQDENYLINNKVKTSLLVPGALLNNNNVDYLIDIGDDGKYDFLAVSIGLEVFEAGYYSLSLDLESYLGVQLYPSAFESEELNINDNNITILIPLHLIKKFELSGPYKIKNIELRKFEDRLDSNEDGFVTGAYNYNDFRDSAKVILNSFYDYGLDENENGLYDYLVINFSVDIPVAGDYSVFGNLAELRGVAGGIRKVRQEIGMFRFTAEELGIYNVSIKFLGIDIRKSKLDGPYTLESVQIYSDFLEDSVSDVYATNEYSYTDFETFTNIRVGWSWVDYLIVGEEGEIPITIYNTGTEDVDESFNVSFFLLAGGWEGIEIFLENITIEGIESDSFEEAIFYYTPIESGRLIFKVNAYINDDEPEDNIGYLWIKSYLERGADLTIYPRIWDKTYIIEEASILDFTIYNGGLETAENIVADLYSVDKYYNETLEEWIEELTLLDSKNLGDLEVYNVIDNNFDYTPSERYNRLLLRVEADNEVFPGDNSNYFTLIAKLRGVDLWGYLNWKDKKNIVAGIENEIKFIINNIGTETAENIVVRFYLNDGYYDDNENIWKDNLTLIEEIVYAGTLDPDALAEFTFRYTPEEELAGDYVSFLINISASNDVNLENNRYFFGEGIVPQSKLINTGDEAFTGTLTFKIQKRTEDGEVWEDVEGKTHTFERTISAGETIKLDEIFNQLEISADEDGNHRVYASFESGGGKIESDWDFWVYN